MDFDGMKWGQNTGGGDKQWRWAAPRPSRAKNGTQGETAKKKPANLAVCGLIHPCEGGGDRSDYIGQESRCLLSNTDT